MKFISDYYYGNEAEQYIFYRIPKVLITDSYFKHLSSDAKILYGLMLDRMGLSIKNNWRDEQNKIYIYFTLEDIKEYMNCGHTKGVKIIAELENMGLIERIKQGQGKPTKIYVKKFFTGSENTYTQKQFQGNQDFYNQKVQTSANEKSSLPQSGSADFQNADTNNNDFINTDFNNTDFNNSKSESCHINHDIDYDIDNENNNYKEYPLQSFFSPKKQQKQLEELIKQQINYDWLLSLPDIKKDEIDSFVLIILDILLSDTPKIRINGEDKPQAVVKSMLSKIHGGSIVYAINKFKEQTHEIKHKKSYLLTCLYNAEIEGTYNGINYLKRMGFEK